MKVESADQGVLQATGVGVEEELSLRQTVAFLRRYGLWAIGVAAALGVVTFGAAQFLRPRYRSEGQLVASQAVLSPTAVGELPTVALNLDGRAFREAALSRQVRQAALKRAFPEKNVSLDAATQYQFRTKLVEGRNSLVLTLSIDAPRPDEAVALAKAWTEALVEWDEERVRRSFRHYRTSLEARLAALRSQLLNARDQQSYQAAIGTTVRDLQLARALEATATGQLSLLDSTSPAKKVFPKPLLLASLAAVVGGVTVIFWGLMREMLNQRLQSAEEAYQLTGLPVLSEFPALPPGSSVEEHRAFKEAASYLRTSLNPLLISTDEKKYILVTSPSPYEGKTSVAIVLAQAYARSGQPTLLVDLDLRHPFLTKRLYNLHPSLPNHTLGLEEFFKSPLQTPKAVAVEKNLWLLPARASLDEPAEVLTREVRTLMRLLAQIPCEVVILDAPPLAFPDPLIVAPHCLGTLLVVAESQTTRRSLAASLDNLRQIGVRILGLVLNRVKEGRLWQSHGPYSYYSYYYRYRRNREETKPVAQKKQS